MSRRVDITGLLIWITADLSYLIILLVLAVALAPLSHFMPSKAQRKVARLRELLGTTSSQADTVLPGIQDKLTEYVPAGTALQR